MWHCSCGNVGGFDPAQIEMAQHPSIVATNGNWQNWQMVAFIAQNRIGRDARRPSLAPLAQSNHGPKEIQAFCSQAIFHPASVVGAGSPMQNACLGQTGQSVSKDVSRNADLQRILKVERDQMLPAIS